MTFQDGCNSAARASDQTECTISPVDSLRASRALCPAHAWIRVRSLPLAPSARIGPVAERCRGKGRGAIVSARSVAAT